LAVRHDAVPAEADTRKRERPSVERQDLEAVPSYVCELALAAGGKLHKLRLGRVLEPGMIASCDCLASFRDC
jgi:hypothetical protein